MPFAIEFVGSEIADPETGERAYPGRIIVGDLHEEFFAAASYWSAEDYREQWRKGLDRIAKGHSESCLITSVIDPQRSEFLYWWLLYREGEEVVFRNGIHFFKQSGSHFNPAEPFVCIPPRESEGDDELPPSEWRLPHDVVAGFIAEW